MIKKFNLTDKLLFVSAFLSLVYSEVLFFNGNKDQAIFIGLWVPSILGFGMYLHLLNNNKNGWLYTLFRRSYHSIIFSRF